jgi:hypothetical protein
MIAVTVIEIPCCPVCFDWMKPVLLFAYPFEGVVWVCLAGHKTLIHGVADDELAPPDFPTAAAISHLAHTIKGD